MLFGNARSQQTTFPAYALFGNWPRPAAAAIAAADIFAILPTKERRDSLPGFDAASSTFWMSSLIPTPLSPLCARHQAGTLLAELLRDEGVHLVDVVHDRGGAELLRADCQGRGRPPDAQLFRRRSLLVDRDELAREAGLRDELARFVRSSLEHGDHVGVTLELARERRDVLGDVAARGAVRAQEEDEADVVAQIVGPRDGARPGDVDRGQFRDRCAHVDLRRHEARALVRADLLPQQPDLADRLEEREALDRQDGPEHPVADPEDRRRRASLDRSKLLERPVPRDSRAPRLGLRPSVAHEAPDQERLRGPDEEQERTQGEAERRDPFGGRRRPPAGRTAGRCGPDDSDRDEQEHRPKQRVRAEDRGGATEAVALDAPAGGDREDRDAGEGGGEGESSSGGDGGREARGQQDRNPELEGENRGGEQHRGRALDPKTRHVGDTAHGPRETPERSCLPDAGGEEHRGEHETRDERRRRHGRAAASPSDSPRVAIAWPFLPLVSISKHQSSEVACP